MTITRTCRSVGTGSVACRNTDRECMGQDGSPRRSVHVARTAYDIVDRSVRLLRSMDSTHFHTSTSTLANYFTSANFIPCSRWVSLVLEVPQDDWKSPRLHASNNAKRDSKRIFQSEDPSHVRASKSTTNGREAKAATSSGRSRNRLAIARNTKTLTWKALASRPRQRRL